MNENSTSYVNLEEKSVKLLSPTYIFTLKLDIVNDITNLRPDYF